MRRKPTRMNGRRPGLRPAGHSTCTDLFVLVDVQLFKQLHKADQPEHHNGCCCQGKSGQSVDQEERISERAPGARLAVAILGNGSWGVNSPLTH